MFDSAPLAMSKPSKLSYYRGAVRSGSVNDRLGACNVIILNCNTLQLAEELYAKLIQVDHLCVVKALGFANGIRGNNCSLLALEPFDMTLEAYTTKQIPGADQNGRLTDDFIALIEYVFLTVDFLEVDSFYFHDLICFNKEYNR
jgi:hypothetical protein